MQKFALLVAIVFTATLCRAQNEESTPNIILLIGDGMGLSQISSLYTLDSVEPNLSRFENIGFIKTASSSHKITDSGAGATAFACGTKTFNGGIGVKPDSTPAVNLVELLSHEGYTTALISTSSITHATPAAFYAHHIDRDAQHEIAAQLHSSEVDYVFGGGHKYFKTKEANYLDSILDKGFMLDTGAKYLVQTKLTNKDIPLAETKRIHLNARKALPKMTDGRGDYCSTALNAVFNLTKNSSDPFFVMVEGSQIDWGGHDNDADYIFAEMKDFDQVVGNALDFAEKDGNTLVIVLADHETGGYTLGAGMNADSTDQDYDIIQPSFSTPGHSATLIPVYAFGPGSDVFRGTYENTEIYFKIINQLIRPEIELWEE